MSKTHDLDFIRENKVEILAAKRAAIKFGDVITSVPYAPNNTTLKSAGNADDTLDLRLVINTTNIMDSHDDVHIPGLWNKSLKERGKYLLLQEHVNSFKNIIQSNVPASVQSMSWAELGANFPGVTEALTFHASLKRDRNPFMFDLYAKGEVTEHSVGMQYVQIHLAIKGEDGPEGETYDKYIDQVANRDVVEAQKYFFAVTEAKIIEGSAVPMGSNPITPTLQVEAGKSATSTGPSIDTPFDINNAIQNIKIQF